MHRILLAVVCVLTFIEPAWALRGGRCRKPTCCRKPAATACAQPSPCGKAALGVYVDPCICRKEPIETYPIPGGGTETRYLGEYHNDGCWPIGDCTAPETIYMTGAPNQPSQECLLEQCSNKLATRKSHNGLDRPVDAGYMPKFVGQLGTIARIEHTDYLKFDCPEQGWVNAKVFIVYLPKHPVIRPNQPARMIAIGYEVTPATTPRYEVPGKYVKKCGQNNCQFYVNTGGVTYAVMTAK